MDTLSIAAFYVASKLTNVGRQDGKVVGGAAATMKLGIDCGEGPAEWKWTYGESCKVFDASCFGLAKTVEAINQRFTNRTAPKTIYIFCSDSSAINAVSNPRSKSAHDAALLFHFSLTSFCTTHADTKFTLVWTPVDFMLESQESARALATEACLRDPPTGLTRVMSAAYQKDEARKKAFREWAQEWKDDKATRDTGLKPHSFATKHTITRPPDGGSHPLWQAATAREKDTKKPLFSRRTTSTALQIAVDHAFTGTYVERFRPTDPHEATQCPCGFRLCTSPHIIHTCPRYNAHRFRANIISTRNPVGPRGGILTNKKQAMGLLTFLQDSCALSRPETGPRAHEPPEPD
ncbi:hypothetical protein EDB85DRAFT_1895368 [Lactarius pseudohatsudake]|nr:hypothetical protein EDB85DRAFT_1895368 [Lactarius pseudohatsudake]